MRSILTINSYKFPFLSIFVFLSIIACQFSCKKFVQIDPPTNVLVDNSTFMSDKTAVAAMVGIYSKMMVNPGNSFANTFITTYGGESSDELVDFVRGDEFYHNALTATNPGLANFWNDAYNYIYQTNAVIEGVTQSDKISIALKNQLLGEAKFFRAFCYFYLLNFFGDVPMALSTDHKVNASLSRSPKSEVYQQIINDLKQSQTLLSENYISGTNSISDERVRPNRWAATALLSRVYLYTEDWTNAENEASTLIDNSGVYSLVSNLNDVFLTNSSEAIWQLLPVRQGINTAEAERFIATSTPTWSILSDQLLNAFEAGDNRRTSWVGNIVVGVDTFHFPFKYKVKESSTITEYYTVLRLAEQYLIRAEARARLENISGGRDDLNIIRNRAFGAPNPTAANDSTSLLSEIEHERRVELMVEFGHRWLDLKRYNRADAVLGLIKPGWESHAVLYPIPQSELQNGGNLVQNSGY